MTVHAPMGLEFDVVFVPNVNKELFGHKMNPNMEKVNEGFFIQELLSKDKVLEMKKRLFRGETEVHEYYPN